MCGIAGHINRDNSPVDRETVQQMVCALKHRGPDAQTVHVDGSVGFGHARLSIIDLEGGHQPLFNEDRSVSVICNGEIYNYREIRSQLLQRGHHFRTGSDCEVIAHLWEDHRTDLVKHLRGMFAFVLYDNKTRSIFGARDRFGQKPLYYHLDAQGFSFASEIKALLVLPQVSKDIDPLALDQFLFHQFVPQPRTLFSSIKKLPAGCCFELKIHVHPKTSFDSRQVAAEPILTELETNSSRIDPGHRLISDAGTMANQASFSLRRYWQPTFAPDNHRSNSEHLEKLEASLIDAVQSHMVADVPVGVFLSGGIDSSLITALAVRFNPRPLETFSISFPGSEHDESPHARAVATALGTKHHEFPFEPSDMRQVLSEAAALFDQPLADTAILPLMALSRSAVEYVKVVLTGDGGDELFAGYRKYQRMVAIPGRFKWLSNVCGRVFPMHKLAACRADSVAVSLLRTRLAMLISPRCRSEYHRQGWEGWERFALYQPETSDAIGGRFDSLFEANGQSQFELDPLNAALQLDQGTVLADRLLHKGDCATMAYGLEARAPLLDHELAEVAGALPLSLKATPKKTKVALREIANRYLPTDVVNRRKKGFSMPLDRWFRSDLRSWTHSCLLDDSVALPRYFRRSAIEQLLAEHAAGKNHSGRIHTLLTFELWCREYGHT